MSACSKTASPPTSRLPLETTREERINVMNGISTALDIGPTTCQYYYYCSYALCALSSMRSFYSSIFRPVRAL